MTLSIDDIRSAAKLIKGAVLRTPTVFSPALSGLSRTNTYLKLENLQVTGSFKVRGAFVKLSGLTKDARSRGVIAASAGNHAQGVAYHAHNLGIPATIVMPKGTPFTKVAKTEKYGARVVVKGEGFYEAEKIARSMAETERLEYIHPYDDALVMAGQGTIGLEILEDTPDTDVLIVPIGGGGLISGIATAAKALKPQIKVIGVEAALYPSMAEAMGKTDHPSARGGQTVAEGIAVKSPGALTTPIVRQLVDDILTVDETSLELAVAALLSEQRIVAEGAGAAALAGLMTAHNQFEGQNVCLVVSGGNIDNRLLSSILMRALAREGRLARLRIELEDRAGMLAKVAQVIGENNGDIIDIHHRRLFYDIPVKMTEVDIVVETLDPEHVGKLVAAIEAAGFPTRILDGTAQGNPG
ncbi:MAG: threonine ammonia-lyase [Rhodospirillales bacterium]|nr:threonine ammonia-lyase [Rhodospirillales bacterium]